MGWVRELLTGSKRHTDLRAGCPGIATNVPGDHLQLLQQAGLVRRATLPSPAASAVYELTDRSHQLKPVLLALAGGDWAAGSHGCRLPWSCPCRPRDGRLITAQWEAMERVRPVAQARLRVGGDG